MKMFIRSSSSVVEFVFNSLIEKLSLLGVIILLIFSNMLEYKAKWYGRTLIKVPQTYPSSQICCNCGYKNPKVKKLHVRKWECPECHTIQDRDMNASINILNKALKQA